MMDCAGRAFLPASRWTLVGHDNEFERQLSSEIETSSWPFCLHTASSLGLSVEDILNRNPQAVNAVNRGSWTPLMYAAYYGHQNVATQLIAVGGDVNVKNNKGQTALMLAAICGHLNLVCFLLKKGAILDAVDRNGMNALFHAVRTASDGVVHYLLNEGSNPNCLTVVDRLSPLLFVAAEGREAMFLAFLKKGADVNHKMNGGHTARSLAAAGRHTRIVNMIDGHLSRSNSVFSLFGGPPLVSWTKTPPSDHRSEKPSDKLSSSKPNNLASLLESIGLAKYYPMFQAEDIDFSVFVTMDDADLQEIGIKLYGPRVKLRHAIENLRKGNLKSSTTSSALETKVDQTKNRLGNLKL